MRMAAGRSGIIGRGAMICDREMLFRSARVRDLRFEILDGTGQGGSTVDGTTRARTHHSSSRRPPRRRCCSLLELVWSHLHSRHALLKNIWLVAAVVGGRLEMRSLRDTESTTSDPIHRRQCRVAILGLSTCQCCGWTCFSSCSKRSIPPAEPIVQHSTRGSGVSIVDAWDLERVDEAEWIHLSVSQDR